MSFLPSAAADPADRPPIGSSAAAGSVPIAAQPADDCRQRLSRIAAASEDAAHAPGNSNQAFWAMMTASPFGNSWVCLCLCAVARGPLASAITL
jgi:hypothetical protein